MGWEDFFFNLFNIILGFNICFIIIKHRKLFKYNFLGFFIIYLLNLYRIFIFVYWKFNINLILNLSHFDDFVSSYLWQFNSVLIILFIVFIIISYFSVKYLFLNNKFIVFYFFMFRSFFNYNFIIIVLGVFQYF